MIETSDISINSPGASLVALQSHHLIGGQLEEAHCTGTGGAGGDLPDGTFGATQDVVVQGIQAVNR